MVTIAVGSENPVKIQAVEQAWQALWPQEEITVTGVSVASGVSDQPMTDEEAITGARNRAQSAMTALNTDFSVGLEGGVQKVGEAYYCSGWAVIVDREGHEGIGSSLRVVVPQSIVVLLKQGIELGIANDTVFGMENSKHAEGYFGAMTNNVVTRVQGYRDGVIVALARFVHPHLFS